jgi:heme O synthase-like polyprenyltransferase
MMLSGAGMMLLAIALFVVMRERPLDQQRRSNRSHERQTFRRMQQTFKDGLQIARTRPVVRTLVLISLISGLSSEAFDRLWTVKILEFDFPELFGTSDPAFWFTVLALIGTLLSLAASLVVNKVTPERLDALADRTTLRTALVVSGLILTPIPLLYLRLRPARASVVQEI